MSGPQRVIDGKKVFIKTFGCQMNVYDSERMAQALAPFGYVETEVMADADVIVLNTCHIREKAAEKVYSELGRVREVKTSRRRRNLETLVAVAGCVAQAEGPEIIRRAPDVDLVVGPQTYHRLPALVREARAGRRQIVETEFPEDDKFSHLPERRVERRAAAFLTVQEGCDKFCTFCVVPYTRGSEFSRPVSGIEAEAHRLVEQGAREITLLGQNVNAYHGAGPDGTAWSLARLIARLASIDGLERLRYTTNHPRDMSEDLIAAHRDVPKLMPHLHLALQSGADRILAAMNRKHAAADYLRLVERIRSARPDIALSTDIIVGFPGETEPEFRATLDIVQQVGFAQAYSFKYSARPGTPAATMAGQIPETVAAERLARLKAMLEAQQTGFNSRCVGQTLPVLFEKAGKHTGQLIGRSPYLQAVHAEAKPAMIGHVLPVRIAAAGPNSLSGIVVAA
jgi:tRNA-2-methylthio-N6-dimethylallyladenosine synthase